MSTDKRDLDVVKRSDERTEWIILGRVIGSAAGWDEQDSNTMVLYEFEPDSKALLPAGDLIIDFERGRAETTDDKGTVTNSVDLLEALSKATKKDFDRD